MDMLARLLGVFSIVPATVLLTAAFLVFWAVRKVDVEGLKSFGRIIGLLFCASACLVYSVGVFAVITGKHPMLEMERCMMPQGQMQGGSLGMAGQPSMKPMKNRGMQKKMPARPMPQPQMMKQPMAQSLKQPVKEPVLPSVPQKPIVSETKPAESK
jgi:hypothetical protein